MGDHYNNHRNSSNEWSNAHYRNNQQQSQQAQYPIQYQYSNQQMPIQGQVQMPPQHQNQQQQMYLQQQQYNQMMSHGVPAQGYQGAEQYAMPAVQRNDPRGYGAVPMGGAGLNPHAVAFVPRSSSGAQQGAAGGSSSSIYGAPPTQNQSMDYYPPGYANVPMYGDSRDHQQQQSPFYQNQNYVHAAPPAMTSFYTDNEAELAAYEAQYNQFGNSQHSQQYVPSMDLQYKMAECAQACQIQEIMVGLEQLISDDDEFDSWAGAIRERMADKNMTDESRNLAVQILCEMAIAVSPSVIQGCNPQYSFARLIRYLVDEIPSLCGASILPVMEVFHGLRGSYELERKCNLLVFFAEVYAKVETEAGNKIIPLGEAVLEQASDIIKGNSANDATMKNLIHVLKLTGPDLDASTTGFEKMSTLLTRLSGFAAGHPQLSESVKTQIRLLVEQRQKGWGGASRTAVSSCSSAPSGAIIGADGTVLDLNDEERKFLESHFGALDSESQELDSSIDDTDVMKEFGQFVKEERSNSLIKQQADQAASLLESMTVSDDVTTTAASESTDVAEEKSAESST